MQTEMENLCLPGKERKRKEMDGWTASNQEMMPVIFVVVLIAIFLPLIIIGLFHLMCQWKIQKKAGNPGWYCLIPLFGPYQLGIVAANKKWAAALYALSYIPTFIFLFLSQQQMPPLVMLLSLAGFVFHIFLQVFIACELLRSFGKHKWAGFMSILFPIGFIIVTAYVALSKSVYCPVFGDMPPQAAGVAYAPYGAYTGRQDAQTGAYYEVNRQDPYYRTQRAHNYCTQCGSALNPGVKFCENCGSKVPD